MIAALVHGELSADPAQRSASNGSAFWAATVRVSAGPETMFISLTTFDATAGEHLSALRKGDSLAATGVLEATVWQGRDGERRGWRLTANQIMTAYQGAKRRKAAGAKPAVVHAVACAGDGLPESDL